MYWYIASALVVHCVRICFLPTNGNCLTLMINTNIHGLFIVLTGFLVFTDDEINRTVPNEKAYIFYLVYIITSYTLYLHY